MTSPLLTGFPKGGALTEHDHTMHTDRTRCIAVPCGMFTPVYGCSFGSHGAVASGYSSLDFDPDATEAAFCIREVPADFAGGDITVKILWTIDATESAAVVWGTHVYGRTEGETLAGMFGALVQTLATPGNDRLKMDTMGTVSTVATDDKIICIRVIRLAADAGDTCTVDACFLGVILEYPADS